MTATDELIQAALAAAELFREGDTPDQPEIRVLVRAADAYQPGIPHVADGCLMCAVRELTEGTPKIWNNLGELTPGQSVSGIVLRTGELDNPFGGYNRPKVRFMDLWLGGHDRVRLVGYQSTLDNAMRDAEAKVGDKVTVAYHGKKPVDKGPHSGAHYQVFTVDVRRGHH